MKQFRITNAARGAAIGVRVMPRAKKTQVSGVMDDGTLKIRLAAPPVDGAANKALVEFLAGALALPKSQIEIVAGEKSQRKLVSLVGITPQQVNFIVAKLLTAAQKGAHDE